MGFDISYTYGQNYRKDMFRKVNNRETRTLKSLNNEAIKI